MARTIFTSPPHPRLTGDDTDIPDIDQMDITYLAEILENNKFTLIDADMKKHVKQVRESRNTLCHRDTETMDATKFKGNCNQLLRSFNEIAKPTFEVRRNK